MLKIVLVEDLADARELGAELLARHGHVVKTACDAESGVELIVSEKPDVAIIDIGLPRKNGFHVAREVREALQRQAPRLVALTGYGLDADRREALAAGFDAYLVKPVELDQLLAALEG